MKLKQIFETQEWENENYGRNNPSKDSYHRASPSDTRKIKFTLKRINRLKKLREVKKLEQLKRENVLSLMYGGGGSDNDDSGF